jgi:hypothetical protein
MSPRLLSWAAAYLVLAAVFTFAAVPCRAVPIGSDELNPLPGVMIAPGTFEWVDFPDARGTHPDTLELGTWAEVLIPPFDPAFPSLVLDVSVDAGSTIDGVGFPSAAVLNSPGGFVIRIGGGDRFELSNDDYFPIPPPPTGDMIEVTIQLINTGTLEPVLPLFLALSGTTLKITVTAVPEPSTFVLLATALLGLLTARHRRRA